MLSSHTPTVTTIICNYNFGDYLERAIKSVLASKYQSRIVLIDDCSTDNSLLVADKYKRYIDIISTPVNSGPSTARNLGINKYINNTDFFLILDADDAIMPNKIPVLLKCFDDANVVVAYADYLLEFVHYNKCIVPEYKHAFSKSIFKQQNIVHSGAMIRAESLKRVGGYNETMRTCEDYNLWARLASVGCIKHVAEFLTIVSVHNKNSTSTVSLDVWNNDLSRVFA